MSEPKHSYAMILGAETAQQIASAILRAAGDVMMPLGKDPDGIPQLATGFFLAVRQIDTIDPRFSQIVTDLLAEGRS